MAGYRCGKQRSGNPQKSATGRVLCPDCAASITGLAAGIIASGGAGASATPHVTAQAIATEGWFQRLRHRKIDRENAPRAEATEEPPEDR